MLPVSPNQVLGGGLQKPALTWRTHINTGDVKVEEAYGEEEEEKEASKDSKHFVYIGGILFQ